MKAGTRDLPWFSPTVLSLAERVLGRRDIRVRAGRRVTVVEPRRVVLDDGTAEPSDLTVWLARAAPPALLARSDVPRDPGGDLLVDEALRAVDGSPVFGASGCIGIAGYPDLPKAGVYAVRESPALGRNLRAALDGGLPLRYRPQKSYLALMNTADGRALWRW